MSKQKPFSPLLLIWLILIILIIDPTMVAAQIGNYWQPQRNIPLYHPETDPPILIADQDRTVHALSAQVIDEESGVKAIVYNQWRLDTGWTAPVDIILPPEKAQVRDPSAYMDPTGILHIAFFSGDEIAASIYYSRAHTLMADQASAWTTPLKIGERALIPENVAIAGDGNGNLVIIYSGNSSGQGLYSVYSEDGGYTWTDPVPIYFTNDGELWPVDLIVVVDKTGRLRTVWSVNNRENYGQAIFFSSFDFNEHQWSEPKTLAETRGNLGTRFPTITEFHDTLIVSYYDGSTGHNYMRQSSDFGQTWTRAYAPFPHVGSNGPASFVVDTNENLHFFWAQRVKETPDGSEVHGMWHSVWDDQSKTWTPYESVVRGEKILDKVGFTSFDPRTARAVVSQGNVILVTWRTDPGSRGNGVWYSYKKIDAPESPIVQLPTPSIKTFAPTEAVYVEPSPSITALPSQVNLNNISQENPPSSRGVGEVLMWIFLIVLLFVVIIIFVIKRAIN